jgi:nucleotide-binding universal stress UspA family protein
MGVGMPVISPELWTTLDEDEKSRRASARNAFAAFCSTNAIRQSDEPDNVGGVSAAWHEVTGGTTSATTYFARVRDLTVIARDSGLAAATDEIGDVLMQCGRPVILVPQTAPSVFASTVAIAWKGTAEAARALTAAMPILRKAKRVVIVSADEGHSGADTVQSGARLVQALRWSGVEAQLRRLPRSPDTPGDILGAVAEEHADLLVMGAYTHSRAREMIFGGLTSRVLHDAQIPVLFCH